MIYGKGGSDFYVETQPVLNYSSIGWDGTKFTVVDNRANHPVGVRWFGAAAYTNWLSQQQGLQPCYDLTTWKVDFTKNGYRLPTEAEWEYAGRGGQYNPYYIYPWGNDADNTKANWPDPNNPDQGPDPNNPFQTGPYPWTTPVGFYNGQLHTKAEFGWPGSQQTYQTSNGSNAWGLYDMAGNVWQWVNDWYDTNYYSVSPYKDPPGPDTGSPLMPDGLPYRNMRGGSWYNGGVGDPGHGQGVEPRSRVLPRARQPQRSLLPRQFSRGALRAGPDDGFGGELFRCFSGARVHCLGVRKRTGGRHGHCNGQHGRGTQRAGSGDCLRPKSTSWCRRQRLPDKPPSRCRMLPWAL